jgi:hypothetical protein
MPSTPLTYPYQFGILQPFWFVGGRMSFDRLRACEFITVAGGEAATFSLTWPLKALRAAPGAAGDRLAQGYYADGFEQSWAAPPGPIEYGGNPEQARKCQKGMATRRPFVKVAEEGSNRHASLRCINEEPSTAVCTKRRKADYDGRSQ